MKIHLLRLSVLAAMFVSFLSFSGPASAEDIKWYSRDEFDTAVDMARKTGRPIAILYKLKCSDCPKHDARVREWRNMPALKNYICIMWDSEASDKLPAQFGTIRQGALDKEGQYVPILYIGTADGEYLDVMPEATSPEEGKLVLTAALKKYGPVPAPAAAAAMWKKLTSARQLWGEGKFAPAMALYQELKPLEKVNPNLPIFKELKADENEINKKGKELVNQARKLLKEGNPEEARALAAKLAQAFKGYDAGQAASEFLKLIPPPQPEPKTQ